MRKVMMAVMAVAVAGMVTSGCSRKLESGQERAVVAETKIDLAKVKKERIQEPKQDLKAVEVKGQQEPSETAVLDRDELSGTGGSGTAAAQGEMVTGTVQAITEKNLTLVIPAEDNRLMRFMANADVTVTRDQQPVTLDSLKAGDEVRASYQKDPSGLFVLRSLDVTKASAPQPAMRQ